MSEQQPRSLTILGSTGSIGTQTLEVISLFPERFRVCALTAHSNASLLIEQALDVAICCRTGPKITGINGLSGPPWIPFFYLRNALSLLEEKST